MSNEHEKGCPKCGQTKHGFDIPAHGIEVCPVPGCGYTSQRYGEYVEDFPAENTLTMEGQRHE